MRKIDNLKKFYESFDRDEETCQSYVFQTRISALLT